MKFTDLRKLSSAAGERLPDPAKRAVRSTAQGWGRMTSELRLTPEFLIVGAQRCGTTTLYRLLSDHPDIARPTMSKGIGYFDLNYSRGFPWYRGHFPVAAMANRGRDRPAVTFESSGYYCYHPLAAERIGRDLPRVKVVMMLRDPVERAHSAYKHEFARGFESETFERALELEPERLDGEIDRMREDPDYESFNHRHHSYVTRGEYSDQIDRLGENVGRGNIYAMDADRFFAEPHEEFTALTAWLGLSAWRPPKVERWNARPGTAITQQTREQLSEHFAPYDEALEKHLGRPPSWR